MNKLHKKEEAGKKSKPGPGEMPRNFDMPSTAKLYHKKLGAYLLLLYQAYLRRETVLEPEIKMALWRMVQLNEEFRSKIRMIHLDYFQKDATNLDALWEQAKETLFPEYDATELKSLSEDKQNVIREYKDTVKSLLALNA